MLRYILLVIALVAPPLSARAQQTDLEEQVRGIAAGLRCVVCQNLSVADSPSELARQMREVIREQLRQGKSPEEIKAYFVSKYGEWVLLAPAPRGFGLLVWVLPFAAAASGIVLVVFMVRRWVKKKAGIQPSSIDPLLIQRVRQDLTEKRDLKVDPESDSPRSFLDQEQARLYGELGELEFDYQARRLSEEDYKELRQELETRAAMVLKELESSAPTPPDVPVAPSENKRAAPKEVAGGRRKSRPGWQVALGGALLVLFGITLGVLLTKSLRPRGSEQDSITGDFLTGTGPGGIGRNSMAGMAGMGGSSQDIQTLLTQGKAAYERQEWSRAMEAFKKVLAIDANQPEGHAYMGLILAQAGHADGALLAFDRALSGNPSFPLALWGKGMILYRAKEDFAGARQALERLASIMPPGSEKDEIQKTIAEIDARRSKEKETRKKTRAAAARARIRGTISIDPKLRAEADGRAVLFIIARAANTPGGPPLAVHKIERPAFPLSYTVGPENVMVAGRPFSGKVLVSARLDKDGNPMTNEPGSLTGEYQKNPVEVGSEKVDIIIDRIIRQ